MIVHRNIRGSYRTERARRWSTTRRAVRYANTRVACR
jgi:hypothetical protein